MVFTPINDAEHPQKISCDYLFSQIRTPSLGFVIASATISVKSLLLQFLFSISNNMSFLNFPVSGIAGNVAFFDFTNSKYDLYHLAKAHAFKVMEDRKASNIESSNISMPFMYNYTHRQEKSLLDYDEVDDIIVAIQDIVERNNIKCLFIHGLSIFCEESLLKLTIKLKDCITHKLNYRCVIIMSIVAHTEYHSQVYSMAVPGKESSNIESPSVSYVLSNSFHNHVLSLSDWIWTIAEIDRQVLIKEKRAQIRERVKDPSKNSYFVNKFTEQVHFLGIRPKGVPSGIDPYMFNHFYIWKGETPFFHPVEFS